MTENSVIPEVPAAENAEEILDSESSSSSSDWSQFHVYPCIDFDLSTDFNSESNCIPSIKYLDLKYNILTQ